MSELRLRIEGPGAETAAAEVGRAVEAELGAVPARTAVTPRSGEGERADPVAVAALVLAIPGAVLQAMDLAERVRLREKLGRLLGRLRALGDGTVEVRVETRGGLKGVGQATADDLIEAGGTPR